MNEHTYSWHPQPTSLLTDHYELTMLQAALRAGTASRRSVFEVFARRLPNGRRYGVFAGMGRVLEGLEQFRFTDEQLRFLRDTAVVDAQTVAYLENFRFTGQIRGYAEGETYFPHSPLLSVESSFAEACVLETYILSVLNFDSAVASAASRMVGAAGERPCIEMGSRRAHEQAAVAAARAAVVAGFDSTSNLEAGFRYGVKTVGTAAHSFTLLHDSEAQAFRAQLDALGRDVLAGSYAAAERESGAVVGMLGTKGGISAGGEIEIGYGFGPAYRGQGYATEAVHALTVHLLAQPRIRTVTAQTALGNRASERVLQKVGFARMDRRWDVGGEVLTLWAVES